MVTTAGALREYLRRTLVREAITSPAEGVAEHLKRFSEVFVDLADPQVTRRAWE